MDTKEVIQEWIKEYKSKRNDGYVKLGMKQKLLEIKEIIDNALLED